MEKFKPNISIQKTTVTAPPVKLNAKWTFETTQDMLKIHNTGWKEYFPLEPVMTLEGQVVHLDKVYKRTLTTDNKVLDQYATDFDILAHAGKYNKLQDYFPYHGIEAELTATLAAEIQKEIDEEIMASITKRWAEK